MFCPHCGEQIADDSKFCGVCGHEVDEGGSSDIVVFDQIGESAFNGRSKRKNVLVKILAVVLVVALIGGGSFGLMKSGIFSGKSSGATDYCVWLSNGNYQFVKKMFKQNSEVINIGGLDNYSTLWGDELYVNKYFAHLTPDGKYLYYFARMDENNEQGTLYRAELGKLKPNHAKNETYIVKIDSDVYTYDFYMREDGTVLYKKNDPDQIDAYRLYYYNGTEVSSIAKNISYVKYTDEVVFFNKLQDDEESYTLYAKRINSDDDIVKLDMDAQSDLYVYDTEHILYKKNIENDDGYRCAIYEAGYSSSSTKIAENVCSDSSYEDYEKTGSFFYLTVKTATKNYSDYIENPHSEADASAVMPDSKAKKYIEEYTYWGYTYTRNNDAYYAAKEDYELSQRRVELMHYFSSATYKQYNYTLYFYDGQKKESGLVSDSVDSSSSYYPSSSGDTLAVNYYKRAENFPKMSIDDLMADDNYLSWDDRNNEGIISDYIYGHSADMSTLYFTVAGGEEQSLDAAALGFTDVTSDVDMVLFNNGKNVAVFGSGYDYDTDKMSRSDVYIAPVANHSIGAFVVASIDEPTWIYTLNDELCCDSDSSLFIYRNNEFVHVAECENSGMGNWYADGTILYLINYDSNYGGTLTRMNAKGEKTKIADDVTSFSELENGKILYVTNGSLKIYDGKNSETLASDVDGFWTTQEKEKTVDDYYFYFED